MTNLWRLLALVLFLSGCRYFNGERKETAEPKSDARLGELRTEADARRAELDELLDADGYPKGADCDATLWAGEAKYAGVPVKLDLVESEPGVVQRRPAPCWTPKLGDVGAKSTVSSDMLAGYMLGRWAEGNYGAFERLAEHGEAHKVVLPIPGWVMGEPYPKEAARVVMRPNGVGLVGRALYALSSGKDDRSYRKWQPLYGAGADYERHVQAVGIFTDGRVAEALRKAGLDTEATQPQPAPADFSLVDVTQSEFQALEHFAEVEPKNAFFQANLALYSGDYETAVDLLLDPETPVPTYVRGGPQRAYELIHWLFTAQIILERFGGE